jgi:hypothetical protein
MNLRTVTLQRLVVLAAIALAIAYLLLLRPLALRVIEEDVPLRDLRQRLATATLEAGLPRETDFLALNTQLRSLQRASEEFAEARREALPRLKHPQEVQERLEEPFQYVEFLNESQRRVEELTALAQSNRVALTPGLARGFPRYQPEVARPELLWAQLATIHRVVRTAIRAGIREISQATVEPLPVIEPSETAMGAALDLPAPATTSAPWAILRVHVTAVGEVDALARLLLSLVLTPEELKQTSLPEDFGDRPTLFIEHLLLRRNQVEAAHQAQLELVVSTAVPNPSPDP